jgi:hypothetical protein
MRSKILLAILAVIFTSAISQAQISLRPSDPSLNIRNSKNTWGVNAIYTESGLGLSGTYYRSLNSTTDFFVNMSVSGVSDGREFEQYDEYGNAYIKAKENRVFSIPVSIGIQKALFGNSIEGNFKPIVSAGIAPALILTTPYDKGFLEQFGYVNAAFAFGGFAGVGLEFQQSRTVAFSFNARYYYMPVIGQDVKSVTYNPISNLGGLQLTFGLNFLR